MYTPKQLEKIAELSEAVTSELYDDFLDGSSETYKIGTMEFYASKILKACDPIAYNCGESDYIDMLLSDDILTEVDGRYYLTEDVNNILNQDEADLV